MNVLFEDYRQKIISTIAKNINDVDLTANLEQAAEDIWLEIIEPIIDACDEELMTLEVKIEELEEEIEDISMEIE